MEKYKHVKTGKIIVRQDVDHKCYNDLFDATVVTSKDWERVRDTYKITSIIMNNNSLTNVIVSFNASGNCIHRTDGIDPDKSKNLSKWLQMGGLRIRSIFRMSDGETFTLGDSISGATYKNRLITGFSIFGNTVEIHQSGGTTQLEDAKKCEEPLFKTTDGVDIFMGDMFYPVRKSDLALYAESVNNSLYKEDKFFTFSSKEKAEEYIRRHKPCLSLQDIEDIWMGLHGRSINSIRISQLYQALDAATTERLSIKNNG